MQKLVIYTILSFLTVYGCSTDVSKQIPDSTAAAEQKTSPENSNKAEDHFIQGAIYDLKGNYAEAILEYQEALQYDEQAGIHYALSKDYLILNKLSISLKHSKAAVKLSPDDIEFNFLLGNVYKIAGQKDSAEVVFTKVIELDSLNFQAYYALGQIYESDKPLKALEIYEKLLLLTGPEWNVLLKIADLNERMGNVDKTINTVEELLKLNPSELQLQKLLIESYLKTNNTEKALVMVNDALTMFPEDLNLIEFKANALILEKKWSEGAAEYKKLIQSESIPFDTKVRIASGFVSEASKDSTVLPIAKDVLFEIAKDSTDWQISAYLGEISIQEGNDSLAIEHFKFATTDAPWNARLWNRLGILLFESQNYEEATKQMQLAVKQFPDDFVDNLILGLSFAQLRKHEEAARALDQAIRINPNDLSALHAYGFTLNQLNRNEEALTYLEKALNVDKNNIQVIGTMGLIYDSMKNYEKSDAIYERALSIDSTDALIANNYAYSLAERGIDLEKALKLAKYAIEIDPESSSYLDTIGWVYFQLGDYERAKEYIEKAIEGDEGNATLLDHLGDVYDKMSNKDKAIELWEEAVKTDSTLVDVRNKLLKGTE